MQVFTLKSEIMIQELFFLFMLETSGHITASAQPPLFQLQQFEVKSISPINLKHKGFTCGHFIKYYACNFIICITELTGNCRPVY